LLNRPLNIPYQSLPDIDELNFFMPTESFISKRVENINKVFSAFNEVYINHKLKYKIISRRYSKGILSLNKTCMKNMINQLELYVHAK